MDSLRALHITHRQVLATLIRFSLNQKDPSALAFIKKSTIAEHLATSEATVYRALSALEDAGLIEREKQQRTRTQFRVVGRIAFTTKLLRCIGVGLWQNPHRGREEERIGQPADAPSDATSLAPMSVINNLKQSSSKKQPRPGAFVRIGKHSVPADLAPLVQAQELKAPALFLLMRLARSAGHRLSNVVAVAGQALEPLRGRDLFAYLKALVCKPVDYDHVAQARSARKAEVEAAAAIAAQARARTAELVGLYSGQRVRGADGTTYEVDSASIVITNHNGHRSSVSLERGLSWLVAMDRVASKHGDVGVVTATPEHSLREGRRALDQLRRMVGLRSKSRGGIGESKLLRATSRISVGFGPLQGTGVHSDEPNFGSVAAAPIESATGQTKSRRAHPS